MIKKRTVKKLKAISLFSGAGGMDVGFSKAGFEILWANDYKRTLAKLSKKIMAQ